MKKDVEYYMGLSYRVEVIEDKDEGGLCTTLPGIAGLYYLCRYD